MSRFDKSTIQISVPTFSEVTLRAAGPNDLELLRQWKNEQREFFFHQGEIAVGQHRQWYELFLKRPYDLMFMVVFDGEKFGCMGIRWQDDRWDIYNVILGLSEYGGRGLMGTAFDCLLAYATWIKSAPISLQVLKHNPAVQWYQKHGFRITETHQTHFVMSYEFNLSK